MLAQAESMHILNAIKEANWVIGGPNGAAKKLGIKRTTLIGKMRRLGLSRPEEHPSHPRTDRNFADVGLRLVHDNSLHTMGVEGLSRRSSDRLNPSRF